MRTVHRSASRTAVLATFALATVAAFALACVVRPAQAAARAEAAVDEGGQVLHAAATQPVFAGVVADANRTVDFAYVIVEESVGADVKVSASMNPPLLSASGPIIAYIEGRAGRVESEHVNTYVAGASGGGGDLTTRFGLIRDASTGNYSIYHLLPQSGTESDVVTVSIKGGGARTLAAGQYIDVVLANGLWWFSNHLGTDTPTASAGVRKDDLDRILALAAKAATL